MRNNEDIKNVIIWGNHSATQYPDIDFAYVDGYGETGANVPVKGLISDEKWVQTEFIKTVQQRVSKNFKLGSRYHRSKKTFFCSIRCQCCLRSF